MKISDSLFKHKSFCAIVAIELIILLFFFVRLCIPNKSYVYLPDDFDIENGAIVLEGDVTYAQIEAHEAMDFVSIGYLSLPAGAYNIYFNYSSTSNSNFAYVDIENNVDGNIEEGYNQLHISNVTFKSYKGQEKLNFYLSRSTDYIKIKAMYMADGNFKISAITLSENHRDELMAIFIVMLLSAVIDGICIARIRRKAPLSAQARNTIAALAVIIFAASLPLFVPYLIDGHDLKFHLLRIEGIKDSIITRQLPSKIQPNWANGNGYAVSVFYGDLFLYIPAFLRLLGFSIHFSYVFYAELVNIATCLIAYYCMKKISRNNFAAIVGSAMYTLSVYRLTNMYIRCAVGEYTAMTFFPLILYGIWNIFTMDVDDKRYRTAFFIPVIGYTGLLQTHIISCEMAGIFTLLTCLLFIKRVFNRKRFLQLVLVGVFTALINAGLLIPFLSYMGEPLKINVGTTYKEGIQHFGAFFAQLFEMFTSVSGLSQTAVDGIPGEMPFTVGLAILTGGAVFFYFLFTGRIKKDCVIGKTGLFCAVMGMLSVFMATVYFPWDGIQRLSFLSAKVITSFQFPWRFLAVASVFLTMAAVVAVKNEVEAEEAKHKWLSIVITVLVVVQSGWIISGVLNEGEVLWAYEESSIDSNFLVGCEYLPDGYTVEHYGTQFLYGSDNVSLMQLDRKMNIIKFYYENTTDEDGYAATSLVAYKGYQAINESTGERLETYVHDAFLYVNLPADSSGIYTVKFVQPVTWIISYFISIISAALLIFAVISERKGKK